MFEKLTEKLQLTLKNLRGQGRITETNIQESLRAVRLALLEADVHVTVVRDFLEGVKGKALGDDVLKSLSPDQHFVKILHDELKRVLGEGDMRLKFPAIPPGVIMLVGLQGSGKTTTAGKLAKHFIADGHPCLLVPADVYRPAARLQLETVGKAVDAHVFEPAPGDKPVAICKKAIEEAKRRGMHRVILDTAGRLTIDEILMEELAQITAAVRPHESLYVADAMTGQSAMGTVKAFQEKVPLSGVILTKADGDARGGAILSVKAVTGLPVKFVGLGEKYDALEPFYPERMASRILGMGDVLTLVERAQAAVEEEEAEAMAEKLRKAEFTLDDFLAQLKQMKKMGPLDQVLGMIPGLGGALKGLDSSQVDEKKLKRVEAVLNSMTSYERMHHQVINGSRRKRIARGAGVAVSEVNQVVKQYLAMRKMMEQFRRVGFKGMRRMLGQMGR
jgi:signal recognition particle subunit SRP54